MKKHRKDVRKTFEALAYLVKNLDPDGIELHFTNSTRVGHETHRKRLLRMLDKVDFDGESMMEITLASVLESNTNKRWSASFLNREKSKGKSVIVLTDGMWHGADDSLCGVPDVIKQKIKEIGGRSKLGIQFIQFGDDGVGSWRLNQLDNELKKYGIKT